MLRLCSATISVALLVGRSVAAQTQSFLFVGAPVAHPLRGIAVQYLEGAVAPSWRAPQSDDLVHRLDMDVAISTRFSLRMQTQSDFTTGKRGTSVAGFGQMRFGSTERAMVTSVGVGLRREASGSGVVLMQGGALRRRGRLDGGASVTLEHPMVEGRDPVDAAIFSGVSYEVRNGLRVGLELAAEDLEGFVERDAEGGAQVFVGPTLTLSPSQQHWTLFAGAGPALLNRSLQDVSGAPREIVTSSGYVVRIAFRWASAQ